MGDNSLFGKNIAPACEYCEFAFTAGREGFRACVKKGVVPVDFHCRHYRYDPILRIPRRPLEIDAFDDGEFTL